MSIDSFDLKYYDPHQIGQQLSLESSKQSNNWLSAFFYLLVPLLLVVRITIFIRRRTDIEVVDFHAGVQALLVMVTCAILVAGSRRTVLILKSVFRTSIGMLLVYYGFAGLSALWSAMPEYSAFRALEFTSQFIAIIVGISCFEDFFKAEKAVLMLGLLVALLGLAGRAKLSGFTSLHTNQYAASASMVLCYCFTEIPRAAGRRRKMLIVFALIGLPIIIVGTCSTTNVATAVGLFSALALLSNRKHLIFAILPIAFVLILFPGLVSDVQETAKEILFPGKSVYHIKGLSGRVEMWKAILTLAKSRPFIGHGFAVQSRIAGISISAHNSLLQVFLDTGIIGILLFSVSALMFVRELVRRLNIVSIGLPGCVAAFICTFVHMMAGTPVGANWLTPSFTFAAFIGLYVNHIHGVTDYRLPYSELEYESCLDYKIVS